MPISTTKLESIRTKALDGLEADMTLYKNGSVVAPPSSTADVQTLIERRTDQWVKRVTTAASLIRWCQYRLQEEVDGQRFSQL